MLLQVGQEALGVIKHFGKPYTTWFEWRELALSMMAPVMSNFTVVLCGWVENLQQGRDVKCSYTHVALLAFSSTQFLGIRFPPEQKTACMHGLLPAVLAGGSPSVYFNMLVLEPDCFKAGRNRCFLSAIKILEGTIAASLASITC